MTQFRAMLCAFAAFFLWVAVDAAIKFASEAALSPFMIMAVLGITGAVTIAGSAVTNRKTRALRPRKGRDQLLICFCSTAVYYANVIALKHLPLTLFYIVVFIAPLVIAAFSAFLKHETLTPAKIACLIAGFLGVFVAMASRGPFGGGEGLGYLAAFISVVFFATSTVTMRQMPQNDATAISNQFWAVLAVATVGIIGVWQTPSFPGGKALAIMVAAGILNVLGNVLYNKALQRTASTNVAQLHYTQIISGALIGYLVWGERPTWGLVAGSVIIIGSGMIVAAQARKADCQPPLH